MVRIMRSVEKTGNRRIRTMCAIGMGVLALGATACSSPSSTTSKPYRLHASGLTFNTPAEQVAAEQATSQYRTAMTTAGVDITTALTTANDQMDSGRSEAAVASLRRALTAFDPVRGMLAPGTGSVQQISLGSSGGQLNPDGVAHVIGLIKAGDPTASTVLQGLVEQATSVQYLLAHKVLLPQQIAFATQGLLGWIALAAPSSLSSTPAEGAMPDDLSSAAKAVQQQVRSLEPLGNIVAPNATADAVRQTDQLVSTLENTGASDPRSVIFTADAALRAIGQMIPALAGFGVHIQGYQ